MRMNKRDMRTKHVPVLEHPTQSQAAKTLVKKSRRYCLASSSKGQTRSAEIPKCSKY